MSMRFLASILLLLFSSLYISAQQTITLGSGTTVHGTAAAEIGPVHRQWEGGRLQFIYGAEEFRDAGVNECAFIRRFGFFVQSLTGNLPGYKLTFQNVNQRVVPGNFIPGVGEKTYFNNYTYQAVGAPGWNMLDPNINNFEFQWDGISNVKVDICYVGPVPFAADGTVRTYDDPSGANDQRAIREDNGSSAICLAQTPDEAVNYKPQIRFEIDLDPNAMVFEELESFQTESSDVIQNANNQLIYGFNVINENCGSPFNLDSVVFNANGSTDFLNDVDRVRLYSTVGNPNFNTNVQLGEIVDPTTTTFTFRPDVTLADSANFFWLAYDIDPDATIDNLVDAELENVFLDGGTQVTPDTMAHPANRRILNDYCIPNNTTTVQIDQITRVRFNELDNPSLTGTFYEDYSRDESRQTRVMAGQDYLLDLDVEINSFLSVYATGPDDYWNVYAFYDWDRNGSFDPNEETYYVGSVNYSTTITIPNAERISRNIQIPQDVIDGPVRMRLAVLPHIREPDANSCHQGATTRGNFEDYRLNVCGRADISQDQLICQDNSVNLTFTNSNADSIQWQVSDDLISWSDVPGAKSPALNTGPLEEPTHYRVISYDSACIYYDSTISNTISLEVPSVPEISVTPDTICPGDQVTLDMNFNYNFVTGSAIAGNVGSNMSPLISTIDLSAEEYLPGYLTDASNLKVCVDIAYNSTRELTMDLISPDGKLINLTNHNGNVGLPGATTPQNHCYTHDATRKIEGQTEALDGDYLPADDFDFLEGENPIGVWTLRAFAHEADASGTISMWSIEFGHQRDIAWSGDGTIDNPDQRTTTATTDETTTYTVEVTGDTECTASEEITVFIVPEFGTFDTTICFGDTLEYAGERYFALSDTVFDDTVKLGASNGCDTVTTVTLTIFKADTIISDTVCFGDSIVHNMIAYDSTGIYFDTIEGGAQMGCDSFLVINLFIRPEVRDTNQVEICQGEIYTENGNDYDTSGTYIDTFENASINGCDSLVITELTVQPTFSDTIFDRICEGDSVVFGDSVYFETGEYLDSFTTISGCDSLVLLNLQVLVVGKDSIDTTYCFGTPYAPYGEQLDTSGTYIDTINRGSISGCDSIVFYFVTVLDRPLNTTDTTICDGNSVVFAGMTVTIAGTYRDTQTAANGCDSIEVLNLTVIDGDSVANIDTSICAGDSIEINGNFETTSGQYDDTTTFNGGCRLIERITLTVLPLSFTTIDTVICEGDSFAFAGGFVSDSNTYFDTLTAFNGCDSIVTLNLSIDSIVRTVFDSTICSGDSIFFAGEFFSNPGQYTDTLAQAERGCDSIIILNLDTLPILRTTLPDVVLCDGDSIRINGTFIDSAGIYFDTLTALTTGCDSILTYNVDTASSLFDTLDFTICIGDTVFGDIAFYTETGIYAEIFNHSNGCDSVTVYNVDVQLPQLNNVVAEICDGDTFTINNQNYTNQGVFNDTLLNASANGCDSIIVLNLTVHPILRTTNSLNLCLGDTLLILDSLAVSEAGRYIDTFTSILGCDSISTIDVVFRETPTLTIFAPETVCSDELATITAGGGFTSYEWSNGDDTRVIEVEAGTYTVTAVDRNGCDVIQSVTVKGVKRLEMNITPKLDTIHAGEEVQIMVLPFLPTYNYSWSPDYRISCLDCHNPIVDPLETTVYEIEISDEQTGCIGRDSVVVMIFSDSIRVSMPTTFTPNGDGENDEFRLFGPEANNTTFEVYDRWNELVFKSSLAENSWDGTFNFRNAPVGIYFVVITKLGDDGQVVDQTRRSIRLIR